MELNEELLSAYRDAVQSASDTEELDGIVGSLPSEKYEEALEDDIEERRSELESSESIDLENATRAEMIDALENRPELRSDVIGHFAGDDSAGSGSQPEEGEGANPNRVDDQPEEGETEITDAKDDWESAGSTDLDTTGSMDGEWDGSDALDEMFDAAEGEDGEIDSEMVQRGVAAFDSSSDGQNKEDYKGPFAVVEDGEMVADLAGIDSLNRMAGQMDVPESVQEDAKDLAESYMPEDEQDEDDGEDSLDENDTLEIEDNLEDNLKIGDDLEGLLEMEDGTMRLVEGEEIIDESARNTLVDAAEGLGINVSGDENAADIVAAINEKARTLDGSSSTTDTSVDARMLFDRLDKYNHTL
jgi:hypothetical protein